MLADSTVFATIAVHSMQLAKEFYGKKLGLKQIDENPGGVMYESGTGKLFVYESQTAGTNLATCAAWDVDDVDVAVGELQSKGVIFEHYDIPNAEVEGVIYTMGTQKVAWFTDPDGNILSVGGETI
jgi:catechol 2,3-dioxygenase-like lactoylglutathione lyase family enzyme